MRISTNFVPVILTVMAFLVVPANAQDGVDGNQPVRSIFERRILPIFRAEKPSSCAECHLSGVDLKDYIRPSEEETFAALLRGGLIDRERPDESKILTFIGRKPAKASLVTDKVRQEEFAA